MKKWLFLAVVASSVHAMAGYVAFYGQNGDPTAPDGRLEVAANWEGGVAPSGSTTGLVYTTHNVWLPSAVYGLAVRQTGGYVYKPDGDYNLRGGLAGSGVATIHEIEDPNTDYASYTNLYVPGKLVFWSQYGEDIQLSLLSGHIEVGDFYFLAKDGVLGTIDLKDGILHAETMTSSDLKVNMLAEGRGKIMVDVLDSKLGNHLYLDFQTGSLGQFGFSAKYDDVGGSNVTAGGNWEWIVKNGQVSIDGMVETNLSAYSIVTPTNNLSSTISLPLPLSPTESYQAWAEGFGLADTNDSAMAADPDGDWVDNLSEYGMGGDPTNPDDRGFVPTSGLVADGGTNWLEYVYFERADKAERGLGYGLEQGLDLVAPAWTNGGIVVVGSGVLNGEFNAVTNRIATGSEVQRFVRLRIDFQE